MREDSAAWASLERTFPSVIICGLFRDTVNNKTLRAGDCADTKKQISSHSISVIPCKRPEFLFLFKASKPRGIFAGRA